MLNEYILLKEFEGKKICFVNSVKELLNKQNKFKEAMLFFNKNFNIGFIDKLKIPFSLKVNNFFDFKGVLLR